jgi:hypothetical protein
VTPQQVVVVVMIPLIAWRLYRRVRSNIGRQVSRMRRHWTAAIFFPVVATMVALAALAHPQALAGLALGLAVGIALAIWGLRLTRFEHTGDGYFYTPNAHIGIALSVVFVARIVWRILEMPEIKAQTGAPPDFASSPLTTVVFGALVGYYTAYAIGILRWRYRLRAAAPPSSAPPAAP